MLAFLRKRKLRKLLLDLPITDKWEGIVTGDLITDEMPLDEAVDWLLQDDNWSGFEIVGRKNSSV